MKRGKAAQVFRCTAMAAAVTAMLLLSFASLGHDHEESHAEHCAACHLEVGTLAVTGPTLGNADCVETLAAAPTRARLDDGALAPTDPIRGPPASLS